MYWYWRYFFRCRTTRLLSEKCWCEWYQELHNNHLKKFLDISIQNFWSIFSYLPSISVELSISFSKDSCHFSKVPTSPPSHYIKCPAVVFTSIIHYLTIRFIAYWLPKLANTTEYAQNSNNLSVCYYLLQQLASVEVKPLVFDNRY